MATTDVELRDWQDTGVVDTRGSAHFRLQAVPIRRVRLGEGFWQPRLATNYQRSIPGWLELMEEHGVVDNFRRAAGRKDVPFRQASFGSESDLYKWLEGAAWALHSVDLPELRETMDEVIDDVAAAQEQDGYLYLNTLFGGEQSPERFSQLARSHELYCAGHLIQAAIAHYRATGDDKLLQVGRRFADYLVQEFGPGKREMTDGHPEVEMALVELYRTTGERSYLDLTGFLLAQPQPAHADTLPPLVERPALVEHCVRSGYICTGAADWYAETGDEKMYEHLLELWEDLVGGKIYVTGGVGARYWPEAFGEPYELPNARAYAETCAQIAHVMWAWRMLLATGEARYADVIELMLYNAFLSGVSLEGTEYFYQNPLASAGGHSRWTWHRCNCCPPNVQRMLASLPGYLLSTSDEGLWVHLYDAYEANLTLSSGTEVALKVATNYPWEGDIELTVTPAQPEEFELFLRIPGWTDQAAVAVNGEPVSVAAQPGSYLSLARHWQPGDVVELELAMPIQIIESHRRIAENHGCVALKRGPVVYCFESVDHPDAEVADLALALDDQDRQGGFRAQWQPQLLGGVVTLHGPGVAPPADQDLGPLYRPRGTGSRLQPDDLEAVAIPYCVWANRGDSAMRVWVPAAPES